MPTNLEIRLNGVLAAFQREPGCRCPRCTDPDKRQRANTSASIILRRGDKPLEHHVVDVGLGVVDSLVEFGDPWPINSIVLTHAHFDHVAGIDWLANSLKRARDSGGIPNQPIPIPVFCTQGTWNIGPFGLFPYLTPRARSKWKLRYRPVTVGRKFNPGGYNGLTLTPLPVVHFGDSVIYILQFWREVERKNFSQPPDCKIIFCWDLLRFTRPDDTKATSGHDYRSGLDEFNPLLCNADLLLIEANTWNPRPKTGHISFIEAQALINLWKPTETRIVHYSGWEDRRGRRINPTNTIPSRGPVSSANLQAAIKQVYSRSVSVGYAGERFLY
jgi:ribonuclease BN (tRNA processing enzyme)